MWAWVQRINSKDWLQYIWTVSAPSYIRSWYTETIDQHRNEVFIKTYMNERNKKKSLKATPISAAQYISLNSHRKRCTKIMKNVNNKFVQTKVLSSLFPYYYLEKTLFTICTWGAVHPTFCWSLNESAILYFLFSPTFNKLQRKIYMDREMKQIFVAEYTTNNRLTFLFRCDRKGVYMKALFNVDAANNNYCVAVNI